MGRFDTVFESVMSGIDSDFQMHGKRHGIDKSQFGQEVTYDGEAYVVTGVKRGGIEIRSEETGERIVVSKDDIQFEYESDDEREFDGEHEHESMQHWKDLADDR